MKLIRVIFILYACWNVNPVSAAIVSYTGGFSATPLSPYPTDLTVYGSPYTNFLIGMDEWQGVGPGLIDALIGSSVTLDSLSTPGKTYNSLSDVETPASPLAAMGATIDSHLIHIGYPDIGTPSNLTVSGSITFDKPIIGFFFTETSLFASDGLAAYLNTTPTVYQAQGPGIADGRGLEPWETLGPYSSNPVMNDQFSVSPDGMTLSLTLNLNDNGTELGAKTDEIRVITSNDAVMTSQLPLPGTAWLLLSGLLPGVFALRKKPNQAGTE